MTLLEDVSHELRLQKDWKHYAEACLDHDPDEPVVTRAAELEADPANWWGQPLRQKHEREPAA